MVSAMSATSLPPPHRTMFETMCFKQSEGSSRRRESKLKEMVGWDVDASDYILEMNSTACNKVIIALSGII